MFYLIDKTELQNKKAEVQSSQNNNNNNNNMTSRSSTVGPIGHVQPIRNSSLKRQPTITGNTGARPSITIRKDNKALNASNISHTSNHSAQSNWKAPLVRTGSDKISGIVSKFESKIENEPSEKDDNNSIDNFWLATNAQKKRILSKTSIGPVWEMMIRG